MHAQTMVLYARKLLILKDLARLAQWLGLPLQIAYLIDLRSRWKCDGDILGTAS